MLTAEEFAAWFRLLETPGVGRSTARRLLAACGSPVGVFVCPPAALRGLVDAATAQALGSLPPEFEARLKATQFWLLNGPDRHVLVLGDPAYPPLLLQTADPPLLLYVQGSLDHLTKPGIAMVGSRRASPQGLANAKGFAQAISEQGWVVFSGLAQGIDAAAHEGALAGAAGTVAVVGTGLDRVYPARHRALAHRIAAHGALVSEFAPGTPPLPEHFPMRNRLIAGMSLGTVVVEAALQSGSLITARLATEAGRDVFAVPGSIHAPQSKGCHWLLKQGAKLVESAQDILEELQPSHPRSSQRLLLDSVAVAEDPAPDPVLAALGHDPVTLDALISRTGFPGHQLSALLMTLELTGQVARLPGGLYQRLVRG